MSLIKKLFATAVLLSLALIMSPAQAELLQQDWFPIERVVIDNGCTGEDGLSQGMYHLTVTTMPQGNLNIHINARGTWTGFVTGAEAKWLENVNDVLPILGENVVYTYQRRFRVLGQGPKNDFFLKHKLHVTMIGDEVTVYFDSFTTDCRID